MKYFLIGILIFIALIAVSCAANDYSAKNRAEADNIRAAQHVYVLEQERLSDVRVERSRTLSAVIIYGLGGLTLFGCIILFAVACKQLQTTYKASRQPVITDVGNGMYLALIDGKQMLGDSWSGTLVVMSEARAINENRIRALRDMQIAERLSEAITNDNSNWIGQAVINRLEDVS